VSALLIGETERAKIAELRAVAAANPFQVAGLMAAAREDVGAVRDMMRMQSLRLPVGFRVAFSHELQPNAPPPGLCAHISVSVDRPGALPDVHAVEMILDAFGMRPLADSHGVWVEDISPGERAVNILQMIPPTVAAGP
jgi:hypothetical protein